MATRRLLKRRRQILDLGNFRKYPDTSLIELSPLLGEAHFSRGPVEQANAQLLLEGLDVARHGCLRQLQLACRTTKALSVYDLDEGRHAGETIHGCFLTPIGCVKNTLRLIFDSTEGRAEMRSASNSTERHWHSPPESMSLASS